MKFIAQFLAHKRHLEKFFFPPAARNQAECSPSSAPDPPSAKQNRLLQVQVLGCHGDICKAYSHPDDKSKEKIWSLLKS